MKREGSREMKSELPVKPEPRVRAEVGPKPSPATKPDLGLRSFRWNIDFGKLIGQRVDVETPVGFRRDSTLLADVKFEDVWIDGIKVGLPTMLVLGRNGDDEIPFVPGLKLRRSKA